MDQASGFSWTTPGKSSPAKGCTTALYNAVRLHQVLCYVPQLNDPRCAQDCLHDLLAGRSQVNIRNCTIQLIFDTPWALTFQDRCSSSRLSSLALCQHRTEPALRLLSCDRLLDRERRRAYVHRGGGFEIMGRPHLSRSLNTRMEVLKILMATSPPSCVLA